jgi:hypothetical protein
MNIKPKKQSKNLSDFSPKYKTDLEFLDEAFEQVNVELLEMFLKKHADYGKGNILANKELGISMRISEKVERLKHLLLKDELQTSLAGVNFDSSLSQPSAPASKPIDSAESTSSPANESVEETWIDIAVYAVIGVLYRRKQFQKLEVKKK